jgi:Phosphotransferase enzyme family
MNLAQAVPEQIAEEASELVGWRVLSAIPVRRGGNNRVFKLVGSESCAILKIYPTQKEDPRDRLGQEFGALSFLARYGVAEVPRPIASDPARHCAAYEWIDGVPAAEIGAAEVDELADFFFRLQALRECDGADTLPEGATPALSPASVAAQLVGRLERLTTVITPDSEVGQFIETSLRPAIESAVDGLRRGAAKAGCDFDVSLPARLRVLSPSDFGFHNALRRPTGRLAFLDFEYFGWDEPAKAVADVMLHAGMSLSRELALRYRARIAAELHRTDPGFPDRFALFFPALRAIWCLILLNEFLPERWARRVFAGAVDDRTVAQARQLAKARDMLTRSFD